MNGIELTPVNTNYLRSDLVYNQLTNNYKSMALAADVAEFIPVKVLLDGSGRAYLTGGIKVTDATPAANQPLGTLPANIIPTADYWFPVVVVRNGVFVSNAVRLGSGLGPIESVTVTAPGSYATLPTVTAVGKGTGASFITNMLAVSAVSFLGGSGYAEDDTITLVGGETAIVLTVTGVNTGAVTTVTVTNGGSFPGTSALPSNPLAQASTSGTGTGATFQIAWGIDTIDVAVSGQGYQDGATISITGGGGSGGGAATATVGDDTLPTLTLMTAPTQNDVVMLDSVQFFVRSYN